MLLNRHYFINVARICACFRLFLLFIGVGSMKNTITFWTKSFFGLFIVSLLSFTSLTAFADDEDSADDVEEVVVTGSRIKRSNLDSPVPLLTLGEEQIELTGEVNVFDILSEIPANGYASYSRGTTNFSVGTGGVQAINLRGLGAARTLVLVNGRRWVPGIPGTPIVDLNSIPTDLIERIEVITGGASAVYGSDAIAGVINIILREDYSGLGIEFTEGAYDEGDGETTGFSLTLGSDFDEGKGNAVFNIRYDEQGGVWGKNRDKTDRDVFWYGYYGASGLLDPGFSSYPPQGRFQFYDAAGASGGYLTTDCSQRNGIGAAGGFAVVKSDTWQTYGSSAACGFNRNHFRYIEVPVHRYSAFAKANYNLDNGTTLFAEINYNESSATTGLEPFPMNSVSDVYLDGTIGVPMDNPFIPAGLKALYESEAAAYNLANPDTPRAGWDDLTHMHFIKRLIDVHTGGATNKRDTIRLAFGAEGDLGSTGWEYSAYYQYGETQRAQVSTRQFNATNFKYALDAAQNADGTYYCKDKTADAFGCVPINVFGIGSITPEMSNWIIYNPMTFSNIKLHVAAFDTTGDITVGDYTFSAAAGIERKEESSFELPDGLQQKGLHGGNQIPAEIGDQDSTGMYVELLFPLIEGMPYVDNLVMETAFRQDDYSTIGKTTATKFGLLWTINDEWRIRSVVGEAVRAPSISDLFAGASQTWTGIPDPCAGLGTEQGGSTNANVIANCNSVASVANAITNGSFDAEQGLTVPGLAYSQLNTQNIYGMVGGNRNVGEETADTTTFGIVWTPTFDPNLSVTLDAYEIEIEDVISQLSASVAIRKCFEAAPASFPNAFCDQHTRFASGHLESWSSYVVNQSFYKNKGMDLAIDYTFDDLGAVPGSLSTSLVMTRLDNHMYRANDEDAGTDYVGEIGHPEDKAKLRFLYTNNDLIVSVDTTYIGDVVDDLSFNHGVGNTDNATCNDISWLTCELADWQVGDYLYVDMQVRYQFTDGMQAWFGVDNLTNKQPPFLPGGTNNGETGTYTASGVYRPWDSQYWYVGFKYKM